MEFVLPNNDDDLLVDTNNNTYTVKETLDVSSLSETKATRIVQEIHDGLVIDSTCIVEPSNFDRLYSLLFGFCELQPKSQLELTELCVSSLSNLLALINAADNNDDNALRLRTAVKMYSYLLTTIVSIAERQAKSANIVSGTTTTTKKKKRRGGAKKKKNDDVESIFEWQWQKQVVVGVLCRVVDCHNVFRLWSLAAPEEEFGRIFMKTASLLLESSTNMRDKTLKDSIFELFYISVRKFKFFDSATSSFIYLLHNFEHLSDSLALLLEKFDQTHDCNNFVDNVIQEIGRIDPQMFAHDTQGARNISAFMSALGKSVPKAVMSNISVLLTHLDGNSYTLRNGIVQMIGNLLQHDNIITMNDNNEEKKKKKDNDDDDDDDDDSKWKSKQALFEIIQDRVHDVNSFSRSKVLQVWCDLVNSNCVPPEMLSGVAMFAGDRLHDKANSVRKYAAALLAALLESNPFDACLSLTAFQKQFEINGSKYKTMLNELRTQIKRKREECEDNDHVDDETNEDEILNALSLEEQQTFQLLKAQLDHICQGIQFIEAIELSMNKMIKLLSSKTVTDVLQVIKFLTATQKFGMDTSANAIRQVLLLIWHNDQSIRDAALNAYDVLYVGDDDLYIGPMKYTNALHSATNLVRLLNGASLGEITSLEQVLSLLTKRNRIPLLVIKCLWEVFCGKFEDKFTTQEQSYALNVLTMMANNDPNIIIQNIKLVVEHGFHDDNDIEPRVAIIAIQKITKAYPNMNELQDNIDKDILKDIESYLYTIITCVNDKIIPERWFPNAEQAINALYSFNPNPDILATKIIREITTQCGLVDGTTTNTFNLARLLFVLGHVAIRQLSLLEQMEARVKKLHSKKQLQLQENEAKRDNKDVIEDELDVNASQDYEIELIREKIESKLLKHGLLGSYASIIVHVCSKPTIYNNELLQSSAVLALCKYMCISSKFCESQLQLLFSILKNSTVESIRANICITIGDLAYRFPNLIEPWTDHMNASLTDTNVVVRKNMLLVLSHLILNDMLKIKGPMSEIALCLKDDDESIAHIARTFFTELASKGDNPVYNILPDAISRLSCESVARDKFCYVLQYLVAFIQKDKQMESLLDKLVHRFDDTNMRKTRDIAFCMAQLSYNEKCVKKLNEYFRLYSKYLADELVYTSFTQIMNKARKTAKPEGKTFIDELKQRIDAAHDKNCDDLESLNKAKVARKKGRRQRRTKKKKSKKDSDDDDDDDDEYGKENHEPIKTKQVPRRTTRRTKRVIVQDNGSRSDDDDDDDIELEELSVSE